MSAPCPTTFFHHEPRDDPLFLGADRWLRTPVSPCRHLAEPRFSITGHGMTRCFPGLDALRNCCFLGRSTVPNPRFSMSAPSRTVFSVTGHGTTRGFPGLDALPNCCFLGRSTVPMTSFSMSAPCRTAFFRHGTSQRWSVFPVANPCFLAWTPGRTALFAQETHLALPSRHYLAYFRGRLAFACRLARRLVFQRVGHVHAGL